MDEGPAQAVSTKSPNKEAWKQAEPGAGGLWRYGEHTAEGEEHAYLSMHPLAGAHGYGFGKEKGKLGEDGMGEKRSGLISVMRKQDTNPILLGFSG